MRYRYLTKILIIIRIFSVANPLVIVKGRSVENMAYAGSRRGKIDLLAQRALRKKHLLKALLLLMARKAYELREPVETNDPLDTQGLRRALDALEVKPLHAVHRDIEDDRIIYVIDPDWDDPVLQEVVDKITMAGTSGYKYALYILLALLQQGMLNVPEARNWLVKVCTGENPSESAAFNALELLVRAGLAQSDGGSYEPVIGLRQKIDEEG